MNQNNQTVVFTMVNNTYSAMLGNLNSIIGTLQQQNPGFALGLIPNRLPGVTLRDHSARAANDGVFEMRRTA